MTLNHIHVAVSDLNATLDWLKEVWQAEPTFTNERLGVVPFGDLTVIFDQAEKDAPITLGFQSDDCDADVKRAVERGAIPLELPTNRSWGTRSAYLQGPGATKFEIEQGLT